MPRPPERIRSVEPRLLTEAQAAGYCSMSRTVFGRECDVQPIEFGSAAVKRYDRFDLDAWIDRRKGAPDERPFDHWLEALDRGDSRAS